MEEKIRFETHFQKSSFHNPILGGNPGIQFTDREHEDLIVVTANLFRELCSYGSNVLSLKPCGRQLVLRRRAFTACACNR